MPRFDQDDPIATGWASIMAALPFIYCSLAWTPEWILEPAVHIVSLWMLCSWLGRRYAARNKQTQ